MTLRTPLSLVRGLGSAKGGTHHFWMQRLTAIALVPLSIWFVVAVVCVANADYQSAITWVRSPLNSTLLVAMIVALFYHAQIGMQVVFEDYIHTEWLKVTVQILLRFVMALLALGALLAVLRVAFGAT